MYFLNINIVSSWITPDQSLIIPCTAAFRLERWSSTTSQTIVVQSYQGEQGENAAWEKDELISMLLLHSLSNHRLGEGQDLQVLLNRSKGKNMDRNTNIFWQVKKICLICISPVHLAVGVYLWSKNYWLESGGLSAPLASHLYWGLQCRNLPDIACTHHGVSTLLLVVSTPHTNC